MRDIVAWVKIKRLHDAFNSWKAPWTSARAEKIDTIANDTHSVWNSIPSGTDSVAKQTTLNSVNSNMAKQSELDRLIHISGQDELSMSTCLHSRTTGVEGEVLNIRGSGQLWLMASTSASSSLDVDVYIDNKLFQFKRCNGYLALNKAYVYFENNKPNYIIPTIDTSGKIVPYKGGCSQLTRMLDNAIYAMTAYDISYTNAPLEFKQSLRIVSRKTYSTNLEIVYYLDE